MPTPSLYEKIVPSLKELSPVCHHSNSFFIGRVPLPPGINDSYEIVTIRPRGKKPYHTLAATNALMQFKQDAGWELKQSICDRALVEAIRTSKQHVHLAMRVRFFYPTLWKHDIDGGEKAVIDAVFLHLGLNDNLVCDKHTTKDVDRDDSRVEVEVSVILV